MSKRGKVRRPRERFSRQPLPVLQSAAWKRLPHAARTVLTILAGQFVSLMPSAQRGGVVQANGVQTLTREVCTMYGMDHDTALSGASELEAHGLIVKTFKGRYKPAPQRRYPSQWALGWLPITHRERDLLDQPEPAPDRWQRWAGDCAMCTARVEERRKRAATRATERGDEGLVVPMPATLNQQITCKRCHSQFTPRRRHAEYCSARCRKGAERDRKRLRPCHAFDACHANNAGEGPAGTRDTPVSGRQVTGDNAGFSPHVTRDNAGPRPDPLRLFPDGAESSHGPLCASDGTGPSGKLAALRSEVNELGEDETARRHGLSVAEVLKILST